MGKSARILGAEMGLSAQEMNGLLKQHGYLDGPPGGYSLTEKGAQYGLEEDHHRGPGGYSWYNRDWTTRTWDESVLEALKHDMEAAPTVADEAEDGAVDAALDDSAADNFGYVPYSSPRTEGDEDDVSVAAWALAAALVAVGALAANPSVQRWCKETAVPGAKKAWRGAMNRIGRSQPHSEPQPPHTEADSAPEQCTTPGTRPPGGR
jgi:hypothetical protein